MISRYEQEHGVKLDQVGRCAANTGQVDKFLNDLHSALTENRPIPNLEGYGLRLYETSKRHPLVRSTAEAYAQPMRVFSSAAPPPPNAPPDLLAGGEVRRGQNL